MADACNHIASQTNNCPSERESSKYLPPVSALHHLGAYLWELFQGSNPQLEDVPTIVKEIIFFFRVQVSAAM